MRTDPITPGNTDADSVMVRVGSTEYPVHHQVAAELARLRGGVNGALVVTHEAMVLRDEAVDLLAEMVADGAELTVQALARWKARAALAVEKRDQARGTRTFDASFGATPRTAPARGMATAGEG